MQQRFLVLAALAFVLSAGVWITTRSVPVMAQTCASQCQEKPIQFRPGQRIEVEVRNWTKRTITMENTGGDREVKLLPGQKLKFYRGGSTDPNLSVAFWEPTATPLNLTLSQPKANLLQIDIRFARSAPGDRAIYIQNDGRIQRL